MKRSFLATCLVILVSVVSLTAFLGGGATAAAPAQPSAADLSLGKAIFLEKCSLCHGVNGNGKGPNAATLNPRPRDFNKPNFWSGDMVKKIQNAVTDGKGMMPPQNLKSDETRAAIAYVIHTFKPETAK